MIKYKRDGNLYDVYPLTGYKKTIGDATVYDRDTRGKAYFYLRLISPSKQFMTADGDIFICADDKYFKTR